MNLLARLLLTISYMELSPPMPYFPDSCVVCHVCENSEEVVIMLDVSGLDRHFNELDEYHKQLFMENWPEIRQSILESIERAQE